MDSMPDAELVSGNGHGGVDATRSSLPTARLKRRWLSPQVARRRPPTSGDPDRYVSLADIYQARTQVAEAKATGARQELELHYSELRTLWEARHARICDDYFGDLLFSTAVLTETGRVYLRYRAGEVAYLDTRLAEVLSRVELIDGQARALLPEKRDEKVLLMRQRRQLVGGQLFAIAQSTLGYLDFMCRIDRDIQKLQDVDPRLFPDASVERPATQARRARPLQVPADVHELEKRKTELGNAAHALATRGLEDAQASLTREARARGNGIYMLGMLCVIVPILVIAFVVGALGHSTQLDEPRLAWSVAAGAVGACISVLTRLVGGRLRVEPAASRSALLMSGASRVIVGAIFGAVVFIFGTAGLVSLPKGNTTDGTTSTTYLWIAFGFLAGFSERWVQDLLGSVEATSKSK